MDEIEGGVFRGWVREVSAPMKGVATVPLIGLAVAFAALEVCTAWIEPWDLFHDELYYWVCSKHFELGYVDHPPFAPWVLAAAVPLLGEGRFTFAILPALCGGATVLLTGRMAQRCGAGTFGQLLAGLGVIVAPFFLGVFSFYSVNAFEVVFWVIACFLVVELLRTGNQRLWLAIGAVAGIALLNKHTFGLLILGLGVACGVTAPLRNTLRSRWFWIGCILALLLVLPNLYWNAVNGWPSLAFYQSRAEMGNLPTTIPEALLFQVVITNPLNVLLWVPGVAFLLFSRPAGRYRPLGVAFATLLLLMLFSGQRRGDRIVGVYPVALAAGAAYWDTLSRNWRTGFRWILPGLLLSSGLLMMPMAIPLLPPAKVEQYFETLGEKPELEPADVGHGIPVILLGRLDWERFSEQVITAWETLPADEQERAVILAPHWLYASVIDYYGRYRGLPPIVAPHNAYYFWRREGAGRDVVVSVGIELEVMSKYFRETRPLSIFRCKYCASWRPDLPILVSYGPVRPLEELLEEWRHFGLDRAPKLRR